MGNLRLADLLVIVIYMASMVYIGVHFTRRQTSTESYFVAKRSIPFWAMGISLFATLLNLGRYNFPMHEYMIGVIGHILILVVGYAASHFFPRETSGTQLNIWDWLAKRKELKSLAVAGK
jgi:hypothetical protein